MVSTGSTSGNGRAHHRPLNNDEIAQVLDYFAASEFSVALLINFGRTRLDWQRLFPPKHIQAQRRRRPSP